ncbi:MAG: SDR family NAD(P)-dependent oxidoreductase [Firmicutes bacterium]|nr:SDR family NAD(P)-dependent oxidoreductase [Bacillota bacterium]
MDKEILEKYVVEPSVREDEEIIEYDNVVIEEPQINEDMFGTITVVDDIDQVCIDGMGKDLVVAEHLLDSHAPAYTEEDEIYMGGWKKRVVVITGASGGIGLHTARRFSLYADVVYNLSRTRQEDDTINFIRTDVTKPTEVRHAIEKIFQKEGQIDILINNAGVGFSGTAEGVASEDIATIFNTNFMGMANACACVIPYMREQKRGRIINISSMAAVFPLPFQSFYSASKAAVNNYTNAIRTEVKPFKIKVTSVMFNAIKTNFSDHRVRNLTDDKAYKYQLAKSISNYEYAEHRGGEPELIARKLFKLSNKKRLRPVYAIGAKNKFMLFCRRFMSAKAVNRAVAKKY